MTTVDVNTDTFSELGFQRPSISKDPSAALDYTFDWTDWLDAAGDTISSYEVTVDGVTLDNHSRAGGLVVAWVSGGTAGEIAEAACTVHTSASRTETRRIYFQIKER